MNTTTEKLYKFNELSKESQESAIENYYYFNVEGDWYDFILQDAYHNCHLIIEDFGDIDREGYVVAKFIWDAESSAEAILKSPLFGEYSMLYQSAKDFIRKSKSLSEDSNSYKKIESEFLSRLENYYKRQLIEEYMELTTRASIIKSLISGNYDFNEYGGLIL